MNNLQLTRNIFGLTIDTKAVNEYFNGKLEETITEMIDGVEPKKLGFHFWTIINEVMESTADFEQLYAIAIAADRCRRQFDTIADVEELYKEFQYAYAEMFAYRKNKDICEFVYKTLIFEEVPEVVAHCVRTNFYNDIAELTTAIIIPDTDYLYGICDDNNEERDYKLITDIDVDEIVKQWDKGDGWEQWKTNRLLEVFADDGKQLYKYIKNCHYFLENFSDGEQENGFSKTYDYLEHCPFISEERQDKIINVLTAQVKEYEEKLKKDMEAVINE